MILPASVLSLADIQRQHELVYFFFINLCIPSNNGGSYNFGSQQIMRNVAGRAVMSDETGKLVGKTCDYKFQAFDRAGGCDWRQFAKTFAKIPIMFHSDS